MSITAMYVLIMKYDANVLKDVITLLCLGLETNTHNQKVTPVNVMHTEMSEVVNFLF